MPQGDGPVSRTNFPNSRYRIFTASGLRRLVCSGGRRRNFLTAFLKPSRPSFRRRLESLALLVPFLVSDGAGRGVAPDHGRAVGAVRLAVLPPFLASHGAGRGVAHDDGRAVGAVPLAVLVPCFVSDSAGRGV